MSNDLDRLRELFQGYADAKRPLSRQGCPDPAEIAASFEPTASRRLKRRIVDHISECSFCREEFTMLVEAGVGEAAAAEPPERSRRDSQPGFDVRGRPRPVPIWRLAAALLGTALMITSFIMVVRQRERWTVLRSGSAAIRLLAPKPDQAVSGPPVCRWKDRTAADHFVLELFDEALLPVWTSGPVQGSELRIPNEIYAGLRPGRRYFWLVTGYSGRVTTGESPMGRFVVRR